MTVLIIEHAAGRADGLGDEAQFYNVSYYVWKPYTGERLMAPLSEFSGVIVGGGPMGVYELDQFSFFREETRLIEEAFSRAIPVLGVCLGAQMIAMMFGGNVEKTFWRRGYLPIRRVPGTERDPFTKGVSETFPTFQFHQDEILGLPRGAELLLTSDNCRVEGFRIHGSPVWGIQSHPEIGREKAQTILGSAYDLDLAEVGDMLLMSNHPEIGMNSRLFGNFFELM